MKMKRKKTKTQIAACAAAIGLALAGCGGAGGQQEAALSQDVQPVGEEAAPVQDTPVSREGTEPEQNTQAAGEQALPAEENQASGEQAAAETAGGTDRDGAFALALENAGVPEEDAHNVKVEQDREHDISIWQVEFETDYGDYDYEISIEDGRIIGADYEVDEEWLDSLGGAPADEEKAKSIAAEKAGGAPAEEVQIRQESDDGRIRFEGELYWNGIKYEFELDAQTGIIFDWNADMREER